MEDAPPRISKAPDVKISKNTENKKASGKILKVADEFQAGYGSE